MIAIGYIRVSGKGQVDGDGPDRQERAINAFTSGLNGFKFQRNFFEAGVTGTLDGMDRPEFAAMVRFIDRYHEDKGPDAEKMCIVVERLDRLARDLMVQELILAECRKRGIVVYSTDAGYVDVASNDGDPTRKLIRQVMGAIAEWDKSQMVRKMGSARGVIRAAKGKCEGAKLFGEYPYERAQMKAIYALWSANYELGWRGVTRLVNDAGLKTRKGTAWTPAGIRRLLLAWQKKGGFQ